MLSCDIDALFQELVTAEPKALDAIDQLAPSVNINFSFLASGRPPMTRSLKPKEVPKPRFAEFAISHGEVSLFVKKALLACFPLSVWGSQHNLDRAISICDEVILYKRYESASLHTLSQGFRLADFMMFQYEQQSTRVPPSEQKARQEYFQEFLYWFVDQWLFDILAVSLAGARKHCADPCRLPSTLLKRVRWVIDASTSEETTGECCASRS